MIRIAAQNFDKEEKEKQNVLQVANLFLRYNKKRYVCELELDSQGTHWPLLARGTKAAGLARVVFLTVGGHAFQLSGYASMSSEHSNTPRSASPVQDLRICFSLKVVSF